MSVTAKILFPCATLAAFIFTACGSNADDSVSSKLSIPEAPDAAIETIAKELSAGNGEILWEAMPASYQNDVNAIAQLAGAKVDAEIYNKGFGLLERLADVADQQKAFILGTQLGGEKPAEQIAQIEAAWPSIIGFFKTLTNSSLASAEGLQAFDGRAFCATTVSTLVEYTQDLAKLSEEPNPLDFGTVKLLESTGNTASLEMTLPDGTVNTEEFSKVESRWVPTELASTWATNIADTKAQLEGISPEEMAQNKPQIMGMITMFEGILTQIEAAETQEQFDQALQGAMMPIMGLMMMQGGMGGGSAPAMPVAPTTAP
ncbi:hypothetical protein QEH52_16930 [Coraliomargarita sp. SDUM461003]|uniref:Imelysin-like domain-containing protein n=1 Tax=Thalassobacterium maritimum TaxID=3041265 RepID=A0ABU1AYI6_9BACT|nr:hypothetical protein [Coraliomargarita sp. SDUM461003]MDQ8209213.1 hypothetical protein [Coraliomargarita sp. SDUM461003]